VLDSDGGNTAARPTTAGMKEGSGKHSISYLVKGSQANRKHLRQQNLRDAECLSKLAAKRGGRRGGKFFKKKAKKRKGP